MNIFNSLSSFLYDKNYFIALFENEIYVYNYKDIILLKETKVSLSVSNFQLNILGHDLFVKQLDKNEILISGIIDEVSKKYE